jgi:2-dehydropantoate 2-reductase
MRYLVYGAGAVGGYLGGSLALAGFPVTFFDRPEVVRDLRAGGLTLEARGQARHLESPALATHLEHLPTQPDVVVLAVKAYDCAGAAEYLRDGLPHPVPVVCVLNGIGNEATLAAALGADRVIADSLTSAIQRLETGLLRVEKDRGIGLAAGHALSRSLEADFTTAGLHPRLYRNADAMKWSKLLINLLANATSAILDWSADEVFRHRGLYRLEVEALREAVRVIRGLGLRPVDLPGVPSALLGTAVFWPDWITHPILHRAAAGGRGEKRPSFAYDVGRGRSEIGWLNGAVVRYGARLSVATPASRVLTDVLTMLIEGKPGANVYRRPESLLAAASAAGVPGLRGYNPDALPPTAQQETHTRLG